MAWGEQSMSYEAKGAVNRRFITGNVSDLMFGQYFEPLGRCTHDGMYEPDHPPEGCKKAEIYILDDDSDLALVRTEALAMKNSLIDT